MLISSHGRGLRFEAAFGYEVGTKSGQLMDGGGSSQKGFRGSDNEADQ
jgi:hypothetical protein